MSRDGSDDDIPGLASLSGSEVSRQLAEALGRVFEAGEKLVVWGSKQKVCGEMVLLLLLCL